MDQTDKEKLEEMRLALKKFFEWFEDNFGFVNYLDDDGIWNTYLDHPQYISAMKLLGPKKTSEGCHGTKRRGLQ